MVQVIANLWRDSNDDDGYDDDDHDDDTTMTSMGTFQGGNEAKCPLVRVLLFVCLPSSKWTLT